MADDLRSPWADARPDPGPWGQSFPEAWRAVVAAYADHVAIEIDGATRTYAALDREARDVAQGLLAAVDGDADADAVAILAWPAPETVVALLGALLAGRVALMLDPREPPEERERIHAYVGTTRALDDADDVRELAASGAAHPCELPAALDPDTPSVLYLTSGTTGTPKIVIRTHATIVNQAVVAVAACDIAPGEPCAVTNPLAFGATAVPLFSAWFMGATPSLYDIGQRGVDPLLPWLREHDIVQVTLVPSVVRAIAGYAGPPIESMKSVWMGGEAVLAADVALLQRVFPNAIVGTGFGANESGTVGAVFVPAGVAIAEDLDTLWIVPGQHVAVVDDEGNEVPQGEPGEVMVSGPNVALGYWGNPPEHESVYSTAPDGSRRVRIADRGRLLPGDRLQLLGRTDHRVKVRGQGVDLVRVESALVGLDGVREAVVSAVSGPGGATHLVAHVVLAPDVSLGAPDLRRSLGEQLAAYAVPGRFRFLDALPRTNRDKVDRQALGLEAESLVVDPVEYVALRDDVDARIAALFADLLVLDEVGLRHDFFEFGGDSLTALELLVALEEEYRIDARDLATQPGLFYEYATVEALGDLVRARRAVDGRDDADGVVVRLTAPGVGGGPPVFLVPGIGGIALMMRNLALRLDGRRAYSFWAYGMLRPAWPDRRLEVMAGRYAQAIRTVEPDEPVVLGGYSFGAHLAFEIARSLRAQGHAPALVVMIDTPAFGGEPAPQPARVEQYGERVRAANKAERLRLFAGSVDWRVKTAYRRATAGIVPRKLGDQFAVFRAHHDRMLRRYEPRGSYDGAVLILRSDEHDYGEPDLGWSRLVTGPVATARVHGHHQQVLREPWVDLVASEMNQAITAACEAVHHRREQSQ